MPSAMVALAMNVGLYQSAAALSSLERWQNVVSQNISSSQVSGFKKRMVQFDVKPMGEVAVANQSRIGEGQVAVFPRVNYSIDFQQGEVVPTGRDLDATIQGDGFFVLRGADGTPAYTRNGEFHIRADRTLVNVDGSEVLGIGDVPIQLQAEEGSIKINEDGSIFQGETQLGRLQVVSFNNNNQLIPAHGGVFKALPGTAVIPVAEPEVVQSHLESRTVSALRALAALVAIARAYEANQKIIQSRDGTMEKTLDALG